MCRAENLLVLQMHRLRENTPKRPWAHLDLTLMIRLWIWSRYSHGIKPMEPLRKGNEFGTWIGSNINNWWREGGLWWEDSWGDPHDAPDFHALVCSPPFEYVMTCGLFPIKEIRQRWWMFMITCMWWYDYVAYDSSAYFSLPCWLWGSEGLW